MSGAAHSLWKRRSLRSLSTALTAAATALISSCSTSVPWSDVAAAPVGTPTTSPPPVGPTRTTATPPGEPRLPVSLGTVPPIHQLEPVDPPVVSEIPTSPCHNDELRAAATDIVNSSMQGSQDVISVTSLAPCRLNGYPTVAFTSPGLPVTVTDGVETRSQPPHDVAVGPSEPVSFVIQVPQDVSGTCPTSETMVIGRSGTHPTVAVSLTPIGKYQTGWIPCGAVEVSALEQGDSPGQYIPMP